MNVYGDGRTRSQLPGDARNCAYDSDMLGRSPAEIGIHYCESVDWLPADGSILCHQKNQEYIRAREWLEFLGGKKDG